MAGRSLARDEIRAKLLRAAERLFAAQGFEATNTNQVARAAGVGVGTLYAHFDDKYALARAITLSAWEELGRRLARASAEAPPGDEPRAWTAAVIDFACDEPDRFRVAFGGARPAARGKGGGPALTLSTRPIERRLRELQQAGAVSPALDPAVAARAWWSMLAGTLCWWIEDPRRAEPARLLATLAQLHPAARGGRPGAA